MLLQVLPQPPPMGEIFYNNLLICSAAGNILSGLSSENISSSDIIARFVDEKLKKERLKLQESDMRKVLHGINITESSNVIYVGHPDLKDIIPIVQRKLPLQRYHTRPMVFVLKEGIIEIESFSISQIETILEDAKKENEENEAY